MESKKFVLDDETLVYGFFKELDINPTGIFASVIMKVFPEMEYDTATDWAEHFCDEMDSAIGSDIRLTIEGMADEIEEVSEATGLWGHYHFDINNVSEVENQIEQELEKCFLPVVKELKKKGAFNDPGSSA